MAAFNYTNGSPHPFSDTFLHYFIRPVSYNDFSFDAHAGNNVTVFSVTMRRLIFIHKIHVYGVVWNFFIELCM